MDDGCAPSDSEATTESTDMQFQNNYTGVHFRIVTIQVGFNWSYKNGCMLALLYRKILL